MSIESEWHDYCCVPKRSSSRFGVRPCGCHLKSRPYSLLSACRSCSKRRCARVVGPEGIAAFFGQWLRKAIRLRRSGPASIAAEQRAHRIHRSQSVVDSASGDLSIRYAVKRPSALQLAGGSGRCYSTDESALRRVRLRHHALGWHRKCAHDLSVSQRDRPTARSGSLGQHG